MVSRFDSFSIRPPTPPKDLKDIDSELSDALEFIQDPFGTHQIVSSAATAKSLLNTPEQSPSSETASSSTTGSRKKKVNFELQTCTIPSNNGPLAKPWTPIHSSPLRPLPQTRVSKPLKSILKASDPISTPPLTDEGATAHKFQSFAEMLESVVKMLAQGARPSKLDAYISLQRTMQAYDKIPDTQTLANKMVLFSQFIRRDMQAVGISGSGPDTQLISQSLKFLMVLVRIPELKSTIDDDFSAFVVDRIITVTADATMPKAVINTHLALLMQQSFRPRTMTVARVEKILDVLDTVHDRVTGYSVQAYRIRVYRKLISQRPEVMTKHTERWFKHILKAMLSGQQDIHQSALDTAICAARSIGADRHVTKSVLTILNRVKSDGNTFGTIFAKELEKSLGSEFAPLVPQIWGCITAFLRDSLHETAFSAIRDWLKVLEKLLSSENDAIRIQANVAFSFLIYAVNVAELTPVNWSKMFLNISQHQLRQRGQTRKSEVDTATSGYLTLLYYALRPTAPYAQLDRYWKEFVADFWRPLVHSSSKHAIAACRVASALLNGCRKPWNEQRALELKPHLMVQREELPLLDPRWVRKAAASVLQYIEVLLDATPWSADGVDDEPAKTMWVAFLDSLVEASSKEVTASSETKDAIAHIVNMLRRMWNRHTTKLALPQHKEDSWADKFCFLIETVVQKLGAFQFADKCLTRNGQDEFEVAPTPSHRSRQHGPRVSPLLYFVDLLVSRSEGKLSDPVRLRVVQLILEPCLAIQNTRLAKLELLRDCSAAINSATKNAVLFDFWNRVGILTKSCLQNQPLESSEHASHQFGREYDVVVDIISLGSAYLVHTSLGHELLSEFVDTVRRETGEGAVVLAVIEKVSGNVLMSVSKEDGIACLPYASILLRNLPKAINRRTLEQGRQNLYPSSPIPGRVQEFDPYDHLYPAIISIGSAAYHNLNIDDTGNTHDFLIALAASIRQNPISMLAMYLRKIQDCVQVWVEDSDRKLEGRDPSVKQMHQDVVNLWQAVSGAFERLPRKDSSILVTLGPLITAGFLSRRRDIVNISINTWNATFGKEDSLRYPARLEDSLQRLRHSVELSVPGLPSCEEDIGDRWSFYDSDSNSDGTSPTKPSPRIKESPFRISKSIQKIHSPSISSPNSRHPSSRRNPKARLRHENSQIQFEPIISSPSNPFDQESQALTERQKEMIERQRITAGIFSNMGSSNGSQLEKISPRQPSQDIPSDVLHSDDFANDQARTPLKALAAIGPMDVYLGSSPTPQARTRSQQQILSDQTSIATPSVVRNVKIAEDLEEFGSSPPRFEKESGAVVTDSSASKGIAGDTFGDQQPDRSYDGSVDEGTTIDDDLLPEVHDITQSHINESSDDELPTDVDSDDVPSSSVEFQLNAQLNAELNARLDSPTVEDSIVQLDIPESSNINADGPSHQQSPAPQDVLVEDKPEVQEPLVAPVDVDVIHSDEAMSGNTSCVEESFSLPIEDEQVPEVIEPKVPILRRSSRHSQVSSPSEPANKTSGAIKRKRGRYSANEGSKNKKTKSEESQEEASQSEAVVQDGDDDGMLDCIVVASPSSKALLKRGRSNRSRTPSSPSSAPETASKRAVRRSASLLSQVETQTNNNPVEAPPASKRARSSTSQDVSEAKGLLPLDSQASQTKRLSHVLVSPRRSSRGSSIAIDEDTTLILSTQSEDASEQNASTSAAPQAQSDILPHVGVEQPQSQQSAAETDTPQRSFAERVILTPRSLLGRLRRMISDCSQIVLGREEERQFDDAMFDLRRAVHSAGRRGEE